MSLESNTRIDSPDMLVDSSASKSPLFDLPMMAGFAQLQSQVSDTASAVLPVVEIFESMDGTSHESNKPSRTDGRGEVRRGVPGSGGGGGGGGVGGGGAAEQTDVPGGKPSSSDGRDGTSRGAAGGGVGGGGAAEQADVPGGKPSSSDGRGGTSRGAAGGGGAAEQADIVQAMPGDNLNAPPAQDPWALEEGSISFDRFSGEQFYTRRYANGIVESSSRTDANGVLLESEVNSPDGSSETVRLGPLGYTRTTSRVEGDRLNVDVVVGDGSTSSYSYLRGPDGRRGPLASSRSQSADGSVEESTYEGRLSTRRLTNADGSTEVETRDADGVTRIISRNADNSVREDRTIRTDNRGLRTTDIVDGNGLRRRETELPGDTAELHEAYRTRGRHAQFVRVDQFDPGDPTGARIARSSIYFTGNGSPPGDILMTERSFDSTGNLRESIDYVPFTGYRVGAYRGGEQVSSRLNPSYVHDRFAYRPRRGS